MSSLNRGRFAPNPYPSRARRQRRPGPRAQRMNNRYSRALKWRPQWDRIRIVTGAASPDPADFANSLQNWQQSQGLPPDGVLGPRTWKKMKPVLDAPEPPEPPPPAEPEPPADGAPSANGADSPGADSGADSGGDAAGDDPQSEQHFGFRARRRCACAKCQSLRAARRPCTCPSCQAEQQELAGVPAPSGKVNRSSKDYVRWYQSALNDIVGAGLAVDGVAGEKTHSAVRAFQAFRGLVPDGIAGARTEQALMRAGAGVPPAGTASTAPAGTNAAVDTPLPRTSIGLHTAGHAESRQFGTRQAIDALLSIGRRWAEAYPNGPRIGIGDISFRGGGHMQPHVSHQRGVDADIRLMRTDGSEGSVTYKEPAYSRDRTQQLVDMIRTNDAMKVELVLFNDLQIGGICEWPGHDNHLHVRFKTGGGVQQEFENEFEHHGRRCTCPQCRNTFASESQEYESGPAAGPAIVDYPVNRKSAAYIRWYQDALNNLLPAKLVANGRRGPKTRAAVRTFQSGSGLKPDGNVGPVTQARLITAGAPLPPRAGSAVPGPNPQPVPPPSPSAPCGPSPTLSAAERDVIAATSTLEGGRPFHCAVSATDGISMGSMQWNLKAGTLQKMLNDFENGTGRLAAFFGTEIDRVRALIDTAATPLADAVAQAKAEKLAVRWRAPLSGICADPFGCTLQQRDIASRLCTAWNSFTPLGLGTVRGLSMTFDIQNGDGSGALATVKARALKSVGWSSLSEADRLQRLANLAADRLGDPKQREERRARRMNLANVRTPYRGSPATPGKSWADIINTAAPNLDRALTTNEKTVCIAPGKTPAKPKPASAPPIQPKPVPPGVVSGETACPTTGDNAEGCKTPQRCDAIPDLVCLKSVSGTPIEYLFDFTNQKPATGKSRPATFKMRPGVREAVGRFVTLASAFGIPIDRILSQGAYVCRCKGGKDVLSNHGKGEAIDVGGVRLKPAGREVLAVNFADAGERVLIRRVNACLRLAFPRVIDYNYNADHHNHFHCEISIPARQPRSETTLRFVQEALAQILGRVIANTGKFDAATQKGLLEFGATKADLGNSARLNSVYDRLFTQVARGGK